MHILVDVWRCVEGVGAFGQRRRNIARSFALDRHDACREILDDLSDL